MAQDHLRCEELPWQDVRFTGRAVDLGNGHCLCSFLAFYPFVAQVKILRRCGNTVETLFTCDMGDVAAGRLLAWQEYQRMIEAGSAPPPHYTLMVAIVPSMSGTNPVDFFVNRFHGHQLSNDQIVFTSTLPSEYPAAIKRLTDLITWTTATSVLVIRHTNTSQDVLVEQHSSPSLYAYSRALLGVIERTGVPVRLSSPLEGLTNNMAQWEQEGPRPNFSFLQIPTPWSHERPAAPKHNQLEAAIKAALEELSL